MTHRRFRSALVKVALAVVPAVAGCYSYIPLNTAAEVPVGERIAVDVTDRGRAELSERLGSGLVRVEGTLTRRDSQDLVLNVWRVASIDGGLARWSGESVRFRREFAARIEARVLNRPRTYMVVGATVVGLFFLSKSFSLFGSYTGGGDTPPPPPPNESRGWIF